MANEFRKVTDQNGVDHPVTDDTRMTWTANGVLGAKNLLPATIYGLGVQSGTGSRTLGTNTDAISFVAPIKRNTDYIISKTGGNRFRVALSTTMPANGVSVEQIKDSDTETSYEFNSGNYDYVYFMTNSGSETYDNIKPMLRLASDTDPTYQPYAMTNRELTELFPTAYKTDGLTYTNLTYDSGGYCKLGKLVIVNIRAKATASNTETKITGLPGYTGANKVICAAANFSDDTYAEAYVTNGGNLIFKNSDVTADKNYVASAIYLAV